MIVWLRIIQLVLLLIAKGMGKAKAIEFAALAFGVSADAIRRRLG